MNPKLVRRLAIALVAPMLMFTAACGDDDKKIDKAPDAVDGGPVTIVGQKFPEADIMAELYKGLLDNAGFQAKVQALGGRDLYLDPLQKGTVQVSTDYLSSMTEALNRQANGDDAKLVASNDADATLVELNKLAGPVGLTALKPAEAQDANGFAVTKAFADENGITTLTELGALGKELKLGAAPDCDKRPDCKVGLEGTYGLKISSVVPTGFGSDETKADLKSGATQLGQVGTSDATLSKDGLVLLDDDKGLQNAENLVPIVNSAWLKEHPQAEAALDALAGVLTTDDLAEMIAEVSIAREKPADVAAAYLQAKGLLK
ncbi:ABC transporter substrate-binding protein [Nocardioides marmoriginsengisoli]|uniref:ABC transporter substrate-binding protein n=1 Tax=Nocardioides marmoriginsengisoli TaxID=661483 RepID=A0A3N0CFK9_9ACTN|nr:ABC transporter substrate-binding protein [Nocardioides marmoriginsengisoli]RNL62228.1 ABC transporter substrate-binding protein [Nocardioides marmoriginsengisoli]